jgi:hypothetical protein
MNVVRFPLQPSTEASGGWRNAELQRLTSACAAYIPSGQASGWEYGETERGDPQLYLLGPGPEQDCILSVSRLGRLYVLEDGNGQVIFEHENIVLLAEQVTTALRSKKQAILSQLAITWWSVREFYEEKVEPAMAEPMEAFSHFALHVGAIV